MATIKHTAKDMNFQAALEEIAVLVRNEGGKNFKILMISTKNDPKSSSTFILEIVVDFYVPDAMDLSLLNH